MKNLHIERRVLLGFSLAIANLIAPSLAMAQTVNAPKYAVGDSWTFRSTDRWTGKVESESTNTIIGIADEFVRLRFDNRVADIMTGQLGAVVSNIGTQRADFTFNFSSKGKQYSRVTYAWPLEPGKKWVDEYILEIRQSDGRKLEFANSSKAEVAGWETVAVPAGTFKAIKVIHVNTITDTTGADAPTISKVVYWYAPVVRRQVKIEEDLTNADGTPGKRVTTELISFKLN